MLGVFQGAADEGTYFIFSYRALDDTWADIDFWEIQQAENDEPGSVQYNYQVWRQQRNERVLAETRSQAENAG